MSAEEVTKRANEILILLHNIKAVDCDKILNSVAIGVKYGAVHLVPVEHIPENKG